MESKSIHKEFKERKERGDMRKEIRDRKQKVIGAEQCCGAWRMIPGVLTRWRGIHSCHARSSQIICTKRKTCHRTEAESLEPCLWVSVRADIWSTGEKFCLWSKYKQFIHSKEKHVEPGHRSARGWGMVERAWREILLGLLTFLLMFEGYWS